MKPVKMTESRPVLMINHHEGAPILRLRQQRPGLRQRHVDVREHRMMRQHHHDEKTAKISERDIVSGPATLAGLHRIGRDRFDLSEMLLVTMPLELPPLYGRLASRDVEQRRQLVRVELEIQFGIGGHL